MVFTFVFPVRAVNTVNTRLAEVFMQMGQLLDCYEPRLDWQQDLDGPPDPEELRRHQIANDQKIWAEGHVLVKRIMDFDQVVSDLQWELTHNQRYGELRIRMLQQVNGIAPVLLNLMFSKVHSQHTSSHEQLVVRRDVRKAIFRLFLGMAHYTDSDRSAESQLEQLVFQAQEANARFRESIESSDFRETLSMGHPGHDGTRDLLVEYAYNGALIRQLRRTRRLLFLRRRLNLEQRGVAVNSDYPGG